jgi:putative transport protein
MEILKTFLQEQPLLSMFLVIGIGYALGGVKVKGFTLGAGAVLFVGLAAGMFAPKAAPPAMVGSLGLVLFVYGIGIQYGRQFFAGVTSPFGLKVNGLVLLSHIAGIGVCWLAWSSFSVKSSDVAGLYCGSLTSTPALQAAISAVGNNEPALGYSVAYPFGFIAPILLMYFANLWIKRKVIAPAGAGLVMREVVVRNPQVIGRSLSEVINQLPEGVRIFIVREGDQNRVPSPDTILAQNDILALTGESEEVIEGAQQLIGEPVVGRISGDREDLDYFRLFISKPSVVGVALGDLQIPGVPEFSVMHLRRGDTDLLARPDLVLEYGDRIGIMINRNHRDAARRHLGDSIKGTTEFSYVSLGIGLALGVILGVLPIPIPGLGTLRLGVAGGPLVMGLILGRMGRTGGLVWNMPLSANIILRNFGLTVFLAQVGMVSGPKFIETVQQTGSIFLAWGAAIVLVAVLFNLLVGHFIFRLSFDELLGSTCGVAANPAQMVFASNLTASDRTDVVYAMTFPTGTIMKILLLQVMLTMMGGL